MTVAEDRRDAKGPPDFDQDAVTRVVGRVEILDVELVGAHFERLDDGPLAQGEPAGDPESIGIGVDWRLSEARTTLGCTLTFGTSFDSDEESPYRVVAAFRLTYSIEGDAPLADSDVEQFVYWNAVFNGYPYWREYLSSTINRAGLPRFAAPVMRMPRRRDPSDETETPS